MTRESSSLLVERSGPAGLDPRIKSGGDGCGVGLTRESSSLLVERSGPAGLDPRIKSGGDDGGVSGG
ncbi:MULTISPECIES: hypothetical protein [Iodidimonas]|uniref:hypothetical protein n=1 Tax=Iodidimonas TaxID=2066486 RepID=UPI001231244B|nr:MULTISPECIES: hypothetical protein [Iodidimonas]